MKLHAMSEGVLDLEDCEKGDEPCRIRNAARVDHT